MTRSLSMPPELVDAISDEIAREKAPLDLQVRALRELFELFTRSRKDLLRRNYLDSPPHRLAYLRYHLPVNVARASCAIADVAAIRPDAGTPEVVIDLGAGPGSASLAALLALPRPPRRFVLTDRSRGALRLAARLLRSVAERRAMPAPEVVTRVEKLPRLPSIPPGSLVLLSMVLNELSAPRGAGLDLDNLLRRLEDAMPRGTTLLIVEPALRAPGRKLLELHDAAVRSGRWKVLAPCTHQKGCPLLRLRDRPWCHFHLELGACDLTRAVAEPLGLEHGTASMSYLATERIAAGAPRGLTGDEAPARVIGDPMRLSRGATGAYICRDGRRETWRGIPPGAGRGDRIRREPRRKGEGGFRVVAPWPGKNAERPRR